MNMPLDILKSKKTLIEWKRKKLDMDESKEITYNTD